jgi:hypothetical protein
VRCCIAYGSGYALNYTALAVIVGHLHLAHQYVQEVMIIFLAEYFYVLQRVWAFAPGQGMRA